MTQVELTGEDHDGDMLMVEPYFRSVGNAFSTKDASRITILNQALQKLVIGLEKYIHESSVWILHQLKMLDIHTFVYKPLGGSSYIKLQEARTVLNARNEDEKMFPLGYIS